MRITAQLIRTADSTHLWSETYDRTLEDIFAVQDDIAQQVVKALEVTLLGDGARRRHKILRIWKRTTCFCRDASSHDGRPRKPARARSSICSSLSSATRLMRLRGSSWQTRTLAQADWYWAPAAEAYTRAREATEKALTLDRESRECARGNGSDPTL